MTALDLARIYQAAQRLRGVARTTPLERSDRLSDRYGAEIYLKREDLQPVRSYKLRGAYNLVASLTEQERARGVVCASAGNHAQGVAYTCRALGVDGVVFVPTVTPRQKLGRIAAVGGGRVRVELEGRTFDEAQAAAIAHAEATGRIVVPPFDDDRIIAGQGTVALEVFDQLAELGRTADVVVVPVGGGGLIAGMGSVAAVQDRPPLVVGAEPDGAPALARALEAGGPVELTEIDTFVDGASVRRVGARTFEVAAGTVERVVTVPEGKVCTTMLELYQEEGVIAEPAGALAVAVLDSLHGAAGDLTGRTVVCVISGGNNDVSRYGDVLERSLVHEGRKHYFLVEFPQEPGALRRFLDDVLGPDDDITLFEYTKKSNRETGPALVGVELLHAEDLGPLRKRMAESSLRIEPVEAGSPLFTFLV